MKEKNVKCSNCEAPIMRRVYPDGWCVEDCQSCGVWRRGKLEETG